MYTIPHLSSLVEEAKTREKKRRTPVVNITKLFPPFAFSALESFFFGFYSKRSRCLVPVRIIFFLVVVVLVGGTLNEFTACVCM